MLFASSIADLEQKSAEDGLAGYLIWINGKV